MQSSGRLGFAQLVGEPVEALVETVALHSTRGLDVPLEKKIRNLS